MDQYPYREDAVGTITESIEWVRAYQGIVTKHHSAIDTLLAQGDAVAISRFLRGVLAGGAR